MEILPGLTTSFWQDDYDSALAVAILAYLGIVLYSLLLFLALSNTYSFLLKQGKWKIYSLSLFYFFSILCIISRILYAIFVIPIQINFYIMPFVTPAVLKIFISISHVMIMLELSIRVKQSILLYELSDPELLTDDETECLYKRKEKMDRNVNLIRFWLTFCIVVIGVSVCVTDRIMSYRATITSNPKGGPACSRYEYLY